MSDERDDELARQLTDLFFRSQGADSVFGIMRRVIADVRAHDATHGAIPILTIEPGGNGLYHAVSRELGLFISSEDIEELKSRIPEVLAAMPSACPASVDHTTEPRAAVTLPYRNWRGETAVRSFIPRRLWWGSDEWHPEPQWLLTALDVEKDVERDFALSGFEEAARASACPACGCSGDMVLVPREPTQAMIEAARYFWGPWIDEAKSQRCGYRDDSEETDARSRAVWGQMLAAHAPETAAEESK